MAKWMIFPNAAAANVAVVSINANMGLVPGGGDVTTTWAVPAASADGNWALAAPEDRFLDGVGGYATGEPVWPVDPGVGA